ncbi:DUF2971 domain-containing protein [Yersinia enterocolitica]|nr:DUF2971 domain-containing protein [Yersinia enterocolitica]
MMYHYTDLNAAKSIIENSTIRLTDIRFLNDKNEFNQGLEILKVAMCEFVFSNEINDIAFLEKVIEWRDLAFEELENFHITEELLFVSSFSRSCDHLNQWRSYGMFSLDFNEEIFKDNLEDENVYFLECIYHHDEDYLSEIINREILLPLFKEWIPNDVTGINELLFLKFKELVAIQALAFKHESFEEENEVRIVFSAEETDMRINFRVKSNMLIPYVEISFDPKAITSLYVGPVQNQNMTEQSVITFRNNVAESLIRKEKTDIEYFLDIICSDIPYRVF